MIVEDIACDVPHLPPVAPCQGIKQATLARGGKIETLRESHRSGVLINFDRSEMSRCERQMMAAS
jgi:hypothetical protein